LRSIFLPPVFEDDEKNIRARVLYGITWPMILLVTIIPLAIGFLIPDNIMRWVIGSGMVDFVGILIIFLVRRGSVRMANYALLAAMWCIAFSFSITSGGIIAPASLAFIIIILMAGLLFGVRGGVYMAIIAIATWAILMLFEVGDLLPHSVVPHDPLIMWAVLSMYGLVAIVVQALANRVIQESMQKAHAGEAMYHAIFQGGNDAMFAYTISREGQPSKFIKVNDAACSWLGYSQAEFLQMTIRDIDAPGMELRRSEAMRSLQKVGTSLFEMEYISRDGRRFPSEVNARLMELDGKPAVLCVARDITRRKQAEDALRESETRYREVFDNTSDGIFLVDITSDGRYRAAGFNAMQLKILELPRAPVGQYMDEVMPAPLVDKLIPHFRKCAIIGIPLHFEESLAFAVSGEHILDVQLIPVRDPRGRVHRLIGITRDVTDERQSAQALVRANQYAENLIATANAMIIHLDERGNVVIMNRAAEEITGYTLTELQGRSWFETIVPRDRFPDVWKIFESIGANGMPANYENPILTKSGEERYIVWQNSTLTDDERVTGTLSFGIDITDRRQREAEMQAISSLSSALRTASARNEMLPVIVEQVAIMLQAPNVSLELFEPANGTSVVENAHGDWARASGMRIPARGGSTDCLPAGQAFVDHDALDHPSLHRPAALGGCREIAGVLLVAQDNMIGSLWIGGEKPITDYDLRLLTAVADIAANAIRRTTFFEQIQRDITRLAALHEIDSAISGTMDLHVSLAVVVSHVVHQLNADAIDVVLFNPVSRILLYGAGQGFHNQAMEQNRLRTAGNLAERVVRERRAIHMDDLREQGDTPETRWLIHNEGFRAYHAVPLLAKGQVLGVLEIFLRTPFEPDHEWLRFFETVAEQAAIAIESAHLFSDLQRANSELFLAYDETIEGWSRALDLRDRETEGHTLRVTELTMKLAAELRLPESEIMHIRRGSLLHDIGKMGVPDSILLKPGKLTESEWVEMKQHPTYAYQLLSPIRYLQPAVDIPYCHHEKWDGGGYPRGLAGEKIPVSARLFALVDVWDALTSDRPYRSAWSEEKTRAHILESAGTHFDPEITQRFLALIQRDDIRPLLRSRPGQKPDA
jgi:PAS domain S-box-containing protein